MAKDAQGTGDERAAMLGAKAVNRLRHVSVHVVEPAPGQYTWVLLEQNGNAGTWVNLLESRKPSKHWNHALTDGMAALMELPSDVREGPREASTQDDALASGMELSLRDW